MGVKVAATCLHWSQPTLFHSPSSAQTLASAISSPCSSKRRSLNSDRALVSKFVHKLAFFGTQPCSNKLYKSRSCEQSKFRTPTMRPGIKACLDSSSDDEFSKSIQELTMRFQLLDDDVGDSSIFEGDESRDFSRGESSKFMENQKPFDPLEPPKWPGREHEIIPASLIERKANSVELPFSLRIIKKKKQWQQGVKVAGESACCSVKKAFSSMVFIIRELQSYTLQMREVLYYEDLQGIVERVQKEMNASFVWLFQQVFSHTPTLMVYVMILLANYSVHSMANSLSFAATPPPLTYTMESISVLDDQSQGKQFDSSVVKSFSVSSSSGKSTLINGGKGGGGNLRPAASGTEGDGKSDGSGSMTIVPDGVSSSSVGNPLRSSEEESVSGQVSIEEELKLWRSVVDEARGMQAETRDESLDVETMQRFVSPVTAKIEKDRFIDYFRTEMFYEMALAQQPTNPLLLANFAQFLVLVAHDYDRAEEYFKKAVAVEPKDAEALNKYASFLWRVRNDLWAAEETYLEAISVDPSNSFYAANYAHFLWNTGGEDTCFPLSSPESDIDI